MGHIHFHIIFNINKKQVVRELLENTKSTITLCKHCWHGKQTKVEFNIKEYSKTKPLEIAQTDMCGPMRTKGLNGEKYFMLLIDDYTRMAWICFLKKKFGSF